MNDLIKDNIIWSKEVLKNNTKLSFKNFINKNKKMENKIKQIEKNQVYQEILKDSHGGVCYMKKKDKYNYKELLSLFEELEDYKENLNGVMLGVYNFLMLEY